MADQRKRTIMAMPPCPPGKWYVNIAPLGEKPRWELRVQPPPENNRLFGYEEREFMAKQYRPRGRSAS